MSSPRSSAPATGPVAYTQALVIDLALMMYLVLALVFVSHTVLRSYNLLERNGYFDAQNSKGEVNANRLGMHQFAYYLFCRGIERANLQATTAWLLGSKPMLPGPNKGWTVEHGEATLELVHFPDEQQLTVYVLDKRGGGGLRLQQKTLALSFPDADGKTVELQGANKPTSNQPGWSTRFVFDDKALKQRAFDATFGELAIGEQTSPNAKLSVGGNGPLIPLVIGSAAAGMIWWLIGAFGLLASPGQRIFGLAPPRKLAPEERPPAFLMTFSGLLVGLTVLTTFVAGWFMIEVNLTNLTSPVRLTRMGTIFEQMFDFAQVQENWKKALDADPKTGSSWDLLVEAVPKMIETLFLAMMATLAAIPIAFCLSFLCARNLMEGNPVTLLIYVLMRMSMNIIRSIEPLAWCIIASVWVGAGTFAGVLALAVHSIAALTKLYSEQIEGVDPGPMEAIRATGAGGLQLLRFGVVPQIIPPFLSFTMYRWDINVRMAPILGFVGGGGIGVLLKLNFDLSNYANVGIIIFLITVLVAAMDFASAYLRGKLM